MTHPIPIRKMAFDVPAAEAFNPLYIAGNATLSYMHTALGLYVVHLEPFIVKSMRKVIPLIRDAALKEEVDRFCRQESQHYQQHADFNKMILARNYPGMEARLDRVRDDFDGYLRDRSDRFRIGFVEGFESYTSQIASALLPTGLYEHKRSEPHFAGLFKWHMLEEVEHRNVAYDIYQHVYGNYPVRAGLVGWPNATCSASTPTACASCRPPRRSVAARATERRLSTVCCSPRWTPSSNACARCCRDTRRITCGFRPQWPADPPAERPGNERAIAPCWRPSRPRRQTSPSGSQWRPRRSRPGPRASLVGCRKLACSGSRCGPSGA